MSALIQELFRSNLYKRTQGRIARQATFAAILLLLGIGAWVFSHWVTSGGTIAAAKAGTNSLAQYTMPIVLFFGLALLSLWISFRIVNIPAFADFLISVEAEMNKVSWPSRGELIRASMVVIFVMFFLAAILYSYDIIWRYLFTNVLHLLDGGKQ